MYLCERVFVLHFSIHILLCVSAPSSFLSDLVGPELALYRDIFDTSYDSLCFHLSVLQMKRLFEF